MKIRTAVAALTTGVALLGAGTAQAAEAPSLKTVVEGPSGVVWSGTCPAWVDEPRVGTLGANCRAFGFDTASAHVAKIRELGGTKVTKSLDGQVADVAAIDGSTLRVTHNPGPWDPEVPFEAFRLTRTSQVTCAIGADGAVDAEACTTDRVIDLQAAQAQADAARGTSVKARGASAKRVAKKATRTKRSSGTLAVKVRG